MNEINIEYDKWKNKTWINDEEVNEGIKVGLHQEFIWKDEVYIILHTEDEIWKHRASGVLKEDYLKSIRVIQ